MTTPVPFTLHVQCPGCLTQAYIGCSCPEGFTAQFGRHYPECALSNPDANVTCDPASTHPNCCRKDHDHAAMANSCPEDHAGDPCPHPAGQCRTWRGAIADAYHPAGDGTHPLYEGHVPPPCPGGHHGKGVRGCTVCRPLILTMPGASPTVIVPVAR